MTTQPTPETEASNRTDNLVNELCDAVLDRLIETGHWPKTITTDSLEAEIDLADFFRNLLIDLNPN